MLFSRLRPLALALLLPGWPSSAAGQTITLPAKDPVYTYVEQMPQLPGGGGMGAIIAAVQQRVALPAGTAAANNRVFVRFTVGQQGQVEDAAIVKGASPVVDAAVLAAVRQLPTFAPGQQNGRLVRVSFTLPISPPGLVVTPTPTATPEPSTEAKDGNWLQDNDWLTETHTLVLGEAERKPGEADSTFARRVLPLSFALSKDFLAAAWRPSAYGKQLFFSLPGTDANEQGTDLLVLDPFSEDLYAVHTFTIPALARFILGSQGEATTLTAIFFADVNQDGQKELLALSKGGLVEAGEWQTYYQTQVFRYLGLSSTGRPQYYEDTAPRAYLDGLATVADVRQALARHQPPRKLPASQAAKTARPAQK
ncbi:TonB family protein [Hymenobacter cheonanensis]|uniref:TonB family protein n=1 Tax=Hymenobacter sp. CA2-7 TaxID=3063993 RepID=UPI0027130218|nr:TonB family protein [Hymenobacter sp. CA2-7]MDO7884962.1 TonB family protein [Hymenobacter sp. CA2-7]